MSPPERSAASTVAVRDSSVRWAAAWTVFIAACALGLGVSAKLALLPLAAAVVALALLTFLYMAFAMTAVASHIQAWFERTPWGPLLVPLAAVGVYLIYAGGTGAFAPLALLRIVGFVTVPTALAAFARGRPPAAWQDFAIVACIWLPFNFDLLSSIWTWPEGQAAYILNTPLAVDLALVVFLGIRRLPAFGFDFRIKAAYLPLVLRALAGFMLLAVPIGLGTGFIAWEPRMTAENLLGRPLAIFFFIAVPEELLFRGLVLNLLLRRTGKPALALVTASLLFGVSHWHTINQFLSYLGSGGAGAVWSGGWAALVLTPGLPDFRYLGLASIAGLFYGWVYLRTGSVAASALLHAAVDSLWELFFHI